MTRISAGACAESNSRFSLFSSFLFRQLSVRFRMVDYAGYSIETSLAPRRRRHFFSAGYRPNSYKVWLLWSRFLSAAFPARYKYTRPQNRIVVAYNITDTLCDPKYLFKVIQGQRKTVL